MKNYFYGIAIGIVITIISIYTGMIKVTPADSAGMSPIQNKMVMEAGILNVAGFSQPGGTTVIPTEPLTPTEACIRVSNYEKANGGKYGLFVTKSLIENLFAGNQHNGIWIFLGKHTPENGTPETNFILKSSTEDFTTEPVENSGYLRVDAMCPSYCDGIDIARCN